MKKKKEKPVAAEPKKKGAIIRLIEWKLKMLDFLSPLSLVALRVYIARSFWLSGLTKIENWDNTIFLFESEYQTHKKLTFFGHEFLTPEMTAIGGTFAELTFPILLILGLAGRFAAASLLVMVAVIQFTYTSHNDHLVWALMLFPIIAMGPGKASWDHFIKNSFYGTMDSSSVKEKLFAILCTLLLTLYGTSLIIADIIKIQ
jgi:putative oxidoreductase